MDGQLTPQPFLHRHGRALILLFLLVLAGGMRFANLSYPQEYYFDEVYYAFTAQEMAKGNVAVWDPWAKPPKGFAYEWTHPPLGKLLIAAGIRLWGDPSNTYSWRLMPAFFGSLALLVIYLLGMELFPGRKNVPLFAAMLYTFDGMPLTLSRITGTDMMLMVLVLLASLYLVKFARSGRLYHLFLTGVFCGLTVSVKWTGLYVMEFLGAVSLIVMLYKKRSGDDLGSILGDAIAHFPLLLLFFIVVPLIIYLISYIPYFADGYTAKELFVLHSTMFGFHQGVTQGHSYSSSWWTWPLTLRPVYLFLGKAGEGVHSHIYTLGNPFIWWTGCVLFFAALWEIWKREVPGLVFAVLSTLAYWLPWAVSPRKVVFNYHFLPAYPFVLLITAYFLAVLWSRGGRDRKAAVAYLAIAAMFFIFFSPLYFGAPLDDSWLPYWFWLKSWR